MAKEPADMINESEDHKGSQTANAPTGVGGDGVPSHEKAAGMPSTDAPAASAPARRKTAGLGVKFGLFAVTAVVVLALDAFSKSIANSYDLGTIFAGPFAGLFQFKLVHNTGAAWSMFSGSTAVLGAIAVVILLILVVAVMRMARFFTPFEFFALGLVFAGGLGNAIDRFTLGYVVDFIQTLFISFPTFNVADIGVTCGIILFALSFGIRIFKEGPASDGS